MAMNFPAGLSFSKWRFELVLACLMALTFIGLTLPEKFLHHHRVIEPGWYQKISTNDDSANGGASQSTLVDPYGYEWTCELRPSYKHPFCGFEIIVGQDRLNGIDLSKYQTLKLWLEYEGVTESIRVNLRNANPDYVKPDDASSAKFNQLEFSKRLLLNEEGGPLEIALENLSVAEWWIKAHDIPPRYARAELDNIVVFEVTTGTDSAMGAHHFKLSRVEFHGYHFSVEDWYFGIILSWLVLLLGYILYRLVQMSRQLQGQMLRESELLGINQVLDARSRKLDLQSKTDHLTGVFNRQGLEEALQATLNERRESKKPLSLIIFDLDHFKSVNDTWGHLVGDEVLIQVAGLVQKNVRMGDILARWGGEEFVLLCKDSTAKNAEALAEKLRELISHYPFAEDLNVTASFGVADIKPGQTLDALFHHADLALYSAKKGGRNRVIGFDQLAS
jgi:diguanylate cyclase (GGDEF)-like protein